MRRFPDLAWVGVAGFFVAGTMAAVGCNNLAMGGPGAASGGSGGASSSSSSSSSGTGDGGDINLGSSSSSSSGESFCDSTIAPDADGDGYTEEQGDCNDCDNRISPDAVELPTIGPEGEPLPPPRDENCDGNIDEPAVVCDSALALASEDPFDAAKAIGLCAHVKSAKWVLADGSDIPTDPQKRAAFHLGHGILSQFGTNNLPREGNKMLMLSSGTARNTEDPGFVYRSFDKQYTSNSPYGATPVLTCGDIPTGLAHDAAAVEFEIKMPSNVLGFTFDFHFFTYAWSDHHCGNVADFFVAKVFPFPPNSHEGNIAVDVQNFPISSNSDVFSACTCLGKPSGPCDVGNKHFFCEYGNAPLLGTPFASDLANPGWSHASTGWLRSTSGPIMSGSTIRIRLATYDTTDGLLDSSTLIDNWQWKSQPPVPCVCIPPCNCYPGPN